VRHSVAIGGAADMASPAGRPSRAVTSNARGVPRGLAPDNESKQFDTNVSHSTSRLFITLHYERAGRDTLRLLE
jgi:hypothetical protein